MLHCDICDSLGEKHSFENAQDSLGFLLTYSYLCSSLGNTVFSFYEYMYFVCFIENCSVREN